MSEHWNLLKKIDDRIYKGGTFQEIVEGIAKLLSKSNIAKERDEEKKQTTKFRDVLIATEGGVPDRNNEIFDHGAIQFSPTDEILLISRSVKPLPYIIGVAINWRRKSLKDAAGIGIYADLIFKSEYEEIVRNSCPALGGVVISHKQVRVITRMKIAEVSIEKENADLRIGTMKAKLAEVTLGDPWDG